MKKIKIIMIVLGCLIIAIGFLCYILIGVSNEKSEEQLLEELSKTEVTRVKDYNEFYKIQELMNNYISATTLKNSEKLFSYLSKTCIEANEITKENILEKVVTYENSEPPPSNYISHSLLKLYKVEIGTEQTMYFTEGCLISGLETMDYNAVITCDNSKGLWCITPDEFVELPTEIEQYADIAKYVTIEKNNYNTIMVNTIDEYTIMQGYFNIYKNRLQASEKGAYSMLDEDFASEKFGSFEMFEEFMQDEKEEILGSYIKTFERTGTDIEGNTVYIGLDTNETRYYFIESYPNEFKVKFE